MEQSSSWEVNSPLASQEISHPILQTPKIRYDVHKIPPLDLTWVR